MSVTQQQVVSLLENVLFETATQAAANAATWQGNPAAADVSTLAAAMANSGEAKVAATIVGYYISALGRAPTAAEVQFYVKVAEQGLTQSQIAAGQVSGGTWDQISKYFSHSPEFMARGGLDSTIGLDQTGLTLQAVPWLYESVLGRAPNAAEIAYYDNLVINGTDLGTLFRYFTTSNEFHADTDAQIANALANFGASVTEGGHPPVVASGVTVGTPPPATTTPVPAPAPAPTDFTTANDTLTATSSSTVYHATLGAGATLNAGDSLVGFGAGNTLIVTDTDSTALTALPGTLSNIATLTLNTLGDVGTSGSPFDPRSLASGTFNLTTDSSATGGDYIRGGTLDVVASTHSAIFSMLSGGHSLDLTDDALTDLTVGGTVTNGVTLHDPAGGGTLTVHLAAVTSGFTDASNQVADLTLSNSTGLSRISGFADTALTTLHASGDVVLGSSSTRFSLGANVATVDLSGITSSAADGTSYFAVNSNGVDFDLGTRNVNVDLNSHTGLVLTAGADANYTNTSTPNIVLLNVDASTEISVANASSLTHDTSSGNSSALLANAAANPGTVFWAVVGPNIFIVESATGTLGSGDTTFIALVGNSHTPSYDAVSGNILAG